MSIAPLPAPLEHIGGRPFAFYPPIRNIAPNEWRYCRATWAECIVTHIASGSEFAIPRTFFGNVSILEDPRPYEPETVVELSRELESRAGEILPVRPRVIELPVRVAGDDEDESPEAPHAHRAPVISIRLESGVDAGPEPARRPTRTIGAALVLGVVACTIVADIARQMFRTPDAGIVSHEWQRLTHDDNYAAVIAKLGPPARERSFERRGRAIRVLLYPNLRFSVVLNGSSRTDERYAETIDLRGRPLDEPLASRYAAPPGY